MVDKDKVMQDWINTNPFLTSPAQFNYLGEHNGDCSISPISSDTRIAQYIDGSELRKYDFAMLVMFDLSSDYDTVNTDNMFTLRQWQDWIDQQQENKNYPDFGEDCTDYKLENLNDMPSMALRYENGKAKYMFMARLIYEDISKSNRKGS